MENESQDQEFQCIEMEPLSNEEIWNKQNKKPHNVRFAPTTSQQGEASNSENDGNDISEDRSENKIKFEIFSLLPSNTLGRGKFRTLSKKKKSSTLPSSSSCYSQYESSNKKSRSPCRKSKSFLYSSKVSSGIHLTSENDTNYLSEEEIRTELMNIRSCPIRMCEKQKYRNAILKTIPHQNLEERHIWSKFLEFCKGLKESLQFFKLWTGALKHIEGLHGTGVVSYFVFLRWLILLNAAIFILMFFLVTLPCIAFPIKPFESINVAPNSSLITEDLLNQFSESSNKKLKSIEKRNTFDFKQNNDVLSHLGGLLDKYLPEEIIDVALHYDKRNFTAKERYNLSEYCGAQYLKEMQNTSSGVINAIQDLLQGTGWMQTTVLFLGFYPPTEVLFFGFNYHMPLAIISVLFVSFLLCFGMMIQYSSHGIQETILARKSNYLTFSNILFCSWDYCIEDKKSSVIRHQSILQEIKSALAEERRKQDLMEWSKVKKFKVYSMRFIINVFVVLVLWGSYYLIYKVVNYQLKELQEHRLNNPGVNTLFVQYLSPIVITILNIFVPIVFNNIVKFEAYNTQTQINIALFRTIFLRLSSVFVLVSLLYQQITCEPKDQCGSGISPTCQSPRCWETYVGQQLYKLVVTDFFVYIIMFIAYDLPRDIIVRRFNNKVTQMVGRQVFDLPNQVLSLVYSQTLCWLGVIYSPLLPAITVIKFVLLFHVKKIMVLRYCIPAPIPYKASRSNAMFTLILMLSFFALIIIHGYSLSSVGPSPACSPFRYYYVMIEAVPDALMVRSKVLTTAFNILFSGIFLFPAIVILCIIIYYYWTIVIAHKKMVKILKAQIILEGRDKQFLLTRLTRAYKGVYS